HGHDVFPREAQAFHPDYIEAPQPRLVAFGHAERNDVSHDTRTPAYEGMMADADELMHRREAADDHIVAHFAVPGERSGIGERHIVPDDAVMRDMAVGHEHAVVAHHGSAAAGI